MATLVTLVTPEPVRAYDFESYGPPIGGGQICPNGFGLTRRIVPCVRETILKAVNDFLPEFSDFLRAAIDAACVLAVAIGGIWVASGRVNASLRDMSILFLKIGAVVVMTHSFGGYFSMFLDIMEEMLAMAGRYALSMSSLSENPACPAFSEEGLSLLVWEQVDCAIEVLIGGIFYVGTLSAGIAGFLMAAILSTTAGVFVGLIGFYLVIQFLYAVARATYTFISAYLAFAFMVLISPMFIPCILFSSTKPYFDKWLRLTISFMVQPMIVFAYISMLMVAFDATVFIGPNSVYRVLAGDAVDTPGFQLGPYLRGIGAYGEQPMGAQTIGINPREILNNLGAPEREDTGTSGTIGSMDRIKQMVDGSGTGAWDPMVGSASGTASGAVGNIYEVMGLGGGSGALRFVRVDWPTTAVDWKVLAAANDMPANGNEDPTEYMIKVIIAFLMAAFVAYIFLAMLDSLPFLSAGIAGVPGGMPILGHGQMKMPGSNLMDAFKNKMAGLAGGNR